MAEENNDKKTYQIKNQEQADLLTDPIGLTILVAMEENQWVTAESLAREIDEDQAMVMDYLLRMTEADMVESHQQEKMTFRKRAQYYSLGQVFSSIPDNIDNHWVFGLIQHLSSDFRDLLGLLKNYDNIGEALEDNEYFGRKSLFLGIQKLYLSEEDLENFRQEINDTIKKYRETSRKNSETREFEAAFFVKPYLPAIYKIISDKREQG